jgi:methionyl aminopeptidase
MMNGLDSLLEAGRIARLVRNSVPDIVRADMPLVDLAERVESMIRDYGGRPAFPCNISIDSVAAHFTPSPDDKAAIPASSVVKVDIGVEIDGYIADTAVTVANNHIGESLRYAAEEALKAAIKMARDGVKVSSIGSAIHSVVTRLGFKPVRNLTGHEIRRYNLHAGVSIPNIPTSDNTKLATGRVYAIEPFVTLGEAAGEVVDGGKPSIFKIEKTGGGNLTETERKVLTMLEERFNSLPYTLRWVKGCDAEFLRIHGKLLKMGRVRGYPVLVEKTGRPVAQAEHTVIVTKDGCEIVT